MVISLVAVLNVPKLKDSFIDHLQWNHMATAWGTNLQHDLVSLLEIQEQVLAVPSAKQKCFRHAKYQPESRSAEPKVFGDIRDLESS